MRVLFAVVLGFTSLAPAALLAWPLDDDAGSRRLASRPASFEDGPRELSYVGMGDAVSPEILRAGIGSGVLGFPWDPGSSISVNSSAQHPSSTCSASTNWEGSISSCSTSYMTWIDTNGDDPPNAPDPNYTTCSCYFPGATSPTFGCTSFLAQPPGNGQTVFCSAAPDNLPNANICSVARLSHNASCSVNATTGPSPGGHGDCSVYGAAQTPNQGAAYCSAIGAGNSCSAYNVPAAQGNGSGSCSAGVTSNAGSVCSVVAGSGAVCTTMPGSQGQCSVTAQGAAGQCSSMTTTAEGQPIPPGTTAWPTNPTGQGVPGVTPPVGGQCR